MLANIKTNLQIQIENVIPKKRVVYSRPWFVGLSLVSVRLYSPLFYHESDFLEEHNITFEHLNKECIGSVTRYLTITKSGLHPRNHSLPHR